MEKDNKTFIELLKEIKKFNKIDLVAQAFQTKYAKETAGEDDDQRRKDADKTNELLGEILTTLKDTKEEEKSESITGVSSPNILNTPEEILAHESKKQTIIFKDLFEISEKSLGELKKISFAITGDKTPSSLLSKRSAAGADTGDGVGGAGGKGSFLGSLLGGAAGGGAAVLGTKALGAGKAAGAGAGAAKAGGLIGGIKGGMAAGGGAALGTAALIAAPFAANAVAKQFGVGGEASYLDPFKGIDNKQAEENFKKMSFIDQGFTAVAAGIEYVGSAVAPNIANEARADRIKKQTKYLALTEGERELKKKDPKTFAKYEEFTRVRTKEYSYDLAKSQGRQTPNDEDIKAAESKAKGEASQRFSKEIEAAGINPAKVKPAPVTKKSEVVPPKDVPGSSVKKAVTGAPASAGSKPPQQQVKEQRNKSEFERRYEEKLKASPYDKNDVAVQDDLRTEVEMEMKEEGYSKLDYLPNVKVIDQKTKEKQSQVPSSQQDQLSKKVDSTNLTKDKQKAQTKSKEQYQAATKQEQEAEKKIEEFEKTDPATSAKQRQDAVDKRTEELLAKAPAEIKDNPLYQRRKRKQAELEVKSGRTLSGEPLPTASDQKPEITPRASRVESTKDNKTLDELAMEEAKRFGRSTPDTFDYQAARIASKAEKVRNEATKLGLDPRKATGQFEGGVLTGVTDESGKSHNVSVSKKDQVNIDSAKAMSGANQRSEALRAAKKPPEPVSQTSTENAAMKDQMAGGKTQSTPIVMNNVSNNNQTTYVPIKGEPRPGSRGSALDRYNDRISNF